MDEPPFDKVIDDVCRQVLATRTLFFAGAGVSAPTPSLEPTTKDLLSAIVCASVPDENTPAEQAILKDLPAELYYQALLEVAGPSVRSIWAVLGLPETSGTVDAYKLMPDLGHYVLAYLAWKSAVPLLTTNYDYRFEEAARFLKLGDVVVVAGKREVKLPRHTTRHLVIWKLRGNALDVTKLDTTLHDLSQVSAGFERSIKMLFERYTACLIGYSGRDFDVYPTIGLARFPRQVLWLDQSFPVFHRIHSSSPSKFVVVTATSTQFARRVLRLLAEAGKLPESLRRAEVAWQQAVKAFETHGEYISRRLEKTRKSSVSALVCQALPKESPDRLLLHGLALAMAGEHLSRSTLHGTVRGALSYLDAYLNKVVNPASRCRALVTKSYCFSELSRYEESVEAAREALAVAKKAHLGVQCVTARASIDSALYTAVFLDVGFRSRVSGKTRLYQVATLFLHLLDYVRFGVQLMRIIGSDRRTPAAIRAHWGYLGHKIRILAISQGVLLRCVPKGFSGISSRLLMVGWRHIEQQCRRRGYPVGLSNVRRYSERLKISESLKGPSARESFSLLVARIETALLECDAGQRALEHGSQVEAQSHFRKCIALAEEVHCITVLLKGFVWLKKSGLTLTEPELRKAREAIVLIQSSVLRDFRDRLLPWLGERAK